MELELDNISNNIPEYTLNGTCQTCLNTINTHLTRPELLNKDINSSSSNTGNDVKPGYLGTYLNKDVIIRKGKYGLYVLWGKKTYSLIIFGNRPIENISYEETINYLARIIKLHR